MSLNRLERHLSLSLPEQDCLLSILLWLHLFILELVVLVDWDPLGLEFLLLVIIVAHFMRSLDRSSQHYTMLHYRDEKGWLLIDKQGQNHDLTLDSMHWNAFRWIMLNMRSKDGSGKHIYLVFCPGDIGLSNFRRLKSVYLLNRNDQN